VFSASWQSGQGNCAGLIFCSFCIKAKGKEENLNPYYFHSVHFPDEKYQKSSTNKAIPPPANNIVTSFKNKVAGITKQSMHICKMRYKLIK
jgi:hypothetical protein